MADSQDNPKRIAVAAALAHLATSAKEPPSSGPVKYRAKVAKKPHVDPGAVVNGGEEQLSGPGVGRMPDCKGKGTAHADGTDSTRSQKETSFYRLKLDDV